MGLFPAALVCWLFGQWLRGPKRLADEQNTDREPIVGSANYVRYAMREIEKEADFNSPPDSFFFSAMYLWGPLLAVVGIFVLLVGWLRIVNLSS